MLFPLSCYRLIAANEYIVREPRVLSTPLCKYMQLFFILYIYRHNPLKGQRTRTQQGKRGNMENGGMSMAWIGLVDKASLRGWGECVHGLLSRSSGHYWADAGYYRQTSG